MAKSRKKVNKPSYTMGTVWFLAIVALSAVGAFPSTINMQIIWLLIMVCGAVVAMHNIRKEEEVTFLISSTAIIALVVFMKVSLFSIMPIIDNFVFNLGVGFGTAAFVVAMALVAKLGLDK